MADKKAEKTDPPAASTPQFDPKPVQLGGESLVDRILPHMKKIVLALVAGAVVLAVIFFFVWLRERKMAAETDKLAAVLDVADRPVAPPAPADPKAPKPQGFATEQERAVAVLDALAKQGGEAAAGATYRASLLVTAGRLDEAIAEYKKATGQPALDGVLAREGLGIALELKATKETDAAARQKGLEDALATFKTMQPLDDGPRRAYALYHQGRILALLGKTDDAKSAFNKAKELAKDSPELPELVDERLASL